MATLSFASMFANRVERGEKLHSIRSRRKRPEQWIPGKSVHLFTAMRTKHCRRLGLGIITSVDDITIFDDAVEIEGVRVDTERELSAFARANGFLTWSQFQEFFTEHYGLPWSGSLIRWQLVTPVSPTALEGKSS